jgi:hypothetical protein
MVHSWRFGGHSACHSPIIAASETEKVDPLCDTTTVHREQRELVHLRTGLDQPLIALARCRMDKTDNFDVQSEIMKGKHVVLQMEVITFLTVFGTFSQPVVFIQRSSNRRNRRDDRSVSHIHLPCPNHVLEPTRPNQFSPPLTPSQMSPIQTNHMPLFHLVHQPLHLQ